ncbi:MAG TPA: biotin/lipoyl-containing protein [Planctomycetota bacterium]|nr:biotin/lipoyl-containing protein [Planctomycetota bacterium]
MSWIEVVVAGVKSRAAVVRARDGVWISWQGMTRFVGPERSSPVEQAAADREVRAPMTGRVIKVATTPGTAVHRGDVLVVLEAMKMEYRLVSPRDGSVGSLGCKEGDRVDLGQVLVTLAS